LLAAKAVSTVSGIFRGVVPKITLYTPYQAIYMGTYTEVRDVLVARGLGGVLGTTTSFAIAGVAAEIAGATIRLPMEVAKLRLQLGVYSSTMHAVKELVGRPSQFYGNFVQQTLMHDCVYSATSWLMYETCRQQIFATRGVGELAVHENVLLGAVTGAACAFVTTPLDVLNTRVTAPSVRPQIRAVALQIARQEGMLAFFSGWTYRVAHLAPCSALYFCLYEVAKMQLARWKGVTD